MQSVPNFVPARTLQGAQRLATALLLLALGACSSLGASGPTGHEVRSAAQEVVGTGNIQIIPVTEAVARQVASASAPASFASTLGDSPATETIIGNGDVIQVSIWEAPPALLFGTSASFGATDSATALASTAPVSSETSIPDMMVNDTGFITVPFAGHIRAAGLTPSQVEREITSRLAGKAHEPQVIVQITRNATSGVTTVGDIANNTRIPLSPRGERLLDVIAAAGGVKTPVDKTTVQITRGDRVVTMPLSAIVRDPAQNIRLQPNDIVTAISQAFSFTSLGATGTSSEIPFESTGITLAQALGRAGGLNADRADPRGVFIFRYENPAAVPPAIASTAPRTAEGKIPVVYTVDMSDPASFFIAQHFPIRDKDVLYVSRARLSDLQRFVSIVASIAFPVINLSRTPLP
jgi:polysaccharide export outer membrane protein